MVGKQIISLSASANNLSNIQEQAEEYAALIMEELDPENVGYIEVREVLLVRWRNCLAELGRVDFGDLSLAGN